MLALSRQRNREILVFDSDQRRDVDGADLRDYGDRQRRYFYRAVFEGPYAVSPVMPTRLT